MVKEVKKTKEVKEVKSVEEKKEKTPEVDEVTVKFKGTSRVYSRELHGDDFIKIAEGFAKKESVQGKVVV